MLSAAVLMMDFELVLNHGFESVNNKEQNDCLFPFLQMYECELSSLALQNTTERNYNQGENTWGEFIFTQFLYAHNKSPQPHPMYNR